MKRTYRREWDSVNKVWIKIPLTRTIKDILTQLDRLVCECKYCQEEYTEVRKELKAMRKDRRDKYS